jgi:hypothetical protein
MTDSRVDLAIAKFPPRPLLLRGPFVEVFRPLRIKHCRSPVHSVPKQDAQIQNATDCLAANVPHLA